MKYLVFVLFFVFCWGLERGERREESEKKYERSDKYYMEWGTLDYDWQAMGEDRQTWIEEGVFIPWNNAMAGIKYFQNKIFVTVPRWKRGVVGTLNEVVNKGGGNGPLLRPWPDLEIQNISNGNITYVQSMEIDPDGIMWIIDAGIQNNLETNPDLYSYSTPQLILMDIMTEKIVKAFDLSDVSVKNVTFLNDIVVDYKKGIAYITDTGGDNGGLIMVNTQTGYMARYEGESTKAYPNQNDLYDICGTEYELGPTPSDGIAFDPIGQRLYYCALTSVYLYSLDAQVFADPTSTNTDIENTVFFHGNKPGMSDGLAISNESVLYFGNNNDCSVQSWNISQKTITTTNVDTLQPTNKEECVWVDTFAFDDNGYLLATTNRLPLFINSVTDYTGYSGANYRVKSWYIGQSSYMQNE